MWSIAITPNGKMLASGSGDRTIKLWNLEKNAIVCTLTEHTDEVYAVAIAADGKTLASGSRDGSIKIWQI